MFDLTLEMTSDQRATLGQEVLEFANEFLSARSHNEASFPVDDASALSSFRIPPAEQPGDLSKLLAIVERSNHFGVDSSAGTHLSYIPNGGIFAGALGEFLAAAMNRYTGGNHASTGAVAIEQGVIDWMLELFGLGERSAGILLSGGSIANLTAIIAARTRFGPDFRNGVVYISVQAHHSVTKACRMAGIAEDRVRLVGADPFLRMDLVELELLIDNDLAAGLVPMAIVASAGTTDSGTIDPLPQIQALAEKHGAWSHADAAYGGFFTLTDRGNQRLKGIERFDSITIDAHKSLFMPFGIGGLLVKNGDDLVAAFGGEGSYMQDIIDIGGLPHFYSLGPELTRPFRGLPVWLGLHLHGVGAFRFELDRMLDLAERAQAELGQSGRVETVGSPDLSVVVMRSVHGDKDTQFLLSYLNDSRRVHLSSTQMFGRDIIRLAFLNPRTNDQDLDSVIELLATAPAPQ